MCANITATQTSKTQDWLTPEWLFKHLDREFKFDLDAAASDDNTLCPHWFTEQDNGLEQEWFGNVFVNFPYNQASKWVEKAYREASCGNCTAVLLMPARTDTKYFWSYCRYGEIRFLPGRLKFGHIDGANFSAPFPSMIVIFRKNFRPENASTSYWNIARTK